jgi:hypothetical protein
MPRLVYKVPTYSLHKPSGLAKVKYQGKVTYLGRHGTKESKDAYAAFVANLCRPEEPATLQEPFPGAELMVSEIVHRYYEHAKGYYRRDGTPTGEHITIRCALRPLVKTFGNLPAKDFSPLKLKKLQHAMVKLGR